MISPVFLHRSYGAVNAHLQSLRDYVAGVDLLPPPNRFGELPEHFHSELIAHLPLDHIARPPRHLGLTVQQFRSALEELRATEPVILNAFQPKAGHEAYNPQLLKILEMSRKTMDVGQAKLRTLAVKALFARWKLPMRRSRTQNADALRRQLMDPVSFVEAATVPNLNETLVQQLIAVAPLINDPYRTHGVSVLRRTLLAHAGLSGYTQLLDDRLKPFAQIHAQTANGARCMPWRLIKALRGRSDQERASEFRALLEVFGGNASRLESMVEHIAYEADGHKAPLFKLLREAAHGSPAVLIKYATFLGHVSEPDELTREWHAILADSKNNVHVLAQLASATRWIKNDHDLVYAFKILCALAPGKSDLQRALAWTITFMPDPNTRFDELLAVSDPKDEFLLSFTAGCGRSALWM